MKSDSNFIWFLADWPAGFSGAYCCSLSAGVAPGETRLPVLASQRSPSSGSVQGAHLMSLSVCERVQMCTNIYSIEYSVALLMFSLFS